MALEIFTLVHVLISIIGIAAGYGALAGLLSGLVLPRWTAIFLITTVATSATGFFFPFRGFTPAYAVGAISLVVLGLAIYALYGRGLAGGWRKVYVITALVALYLNSFVLVAQFFQKIPALKALAPTQAEPPFAICQGALLVMFIWLGVVAAKKRAAAV